MSPTGSPASWADIGAAFDGLAPKSPQERAPLLAEIRARDPGLAAELASLLAAHDSADGFFEEKVPRLFGALAPDGGFGPGDRLLHFEIVELLGEGSLARVYLARDTELGRLVALKVTPNQSKEARTLAHFSFDGIIQVHSEHVVDKGGVLLRVICLQFVAGPTLARVASAMQPNDGRAGAADTGPGALLRLIENTGDHEVAFEPAALQWRGRLATATLAEGIVLLGARLAETLGHAHARGVLHLDIKPANILIDPYGRPYLSDFNVSTYAERLLAGDLRGIGGTPHYMPPEQARLFETAPDQRAGDAIDARADVYALGVVLVDLLTKAGFEDPRLALILERAVRPERAERTASARELADELRAWLVGSLAEKEMPKLWRGFRWILNRPLLAVFTLTLASQVVASVINISYNQQQIMAELSPVQNEVFAKAVGLYNLFSYPLVLLFVCLTLRALFAKSVEPERGRRTVLRLPAVVFVAVSIGWLPGAWFFPFVIDRYAGPIDPSIYRRFAISFSLAWLISATTSLAVTLFVLTRALYPRYWRGRSDLARTELRLAGGLGALLMISAALIPMAGVFMLVLLTPHEYSIGDYQSFKILIMATVGFGLLNILLVQRLTQLAEASLSALKAHRSFGS